MLDVIYYLLVFTRWINVFTLHSLTAPVRNVNIIIIVIVYESVLFSHDISGKYYDRVTNLMASRNVILFHKRLIPIIRVICEYCNFKLAGKRVKINSIIINKLK